MPYLNDHYLQNDRLTYWEGLLDTILPADPDQWPQIAQVERAITHLLSGLTARRRPIPVRSSANHMDGRATLREYLRHGEFIQQPVYHERKREKQLIILLDLSESCLAFANWCAVVAVAAQHIIPAVSIWGFNHSVYVLENVCDDAVQFLNHLSQELSTTPAYCLLDLPQMLSAISQQLSSTAQLEVWVISDAILSPGRNFDLSEEALVEQRQYLKLFSNIRILDPTTLYPPPDLSRPEMPCEDPVTGEMLITGKQLLQFFASIDANTSATIDWRVAEFTKQLPLFTLDYSRLQSIAYQMVDETVLSVRRCTPWLNALKAHNQLPSLQIIHRRQPGTQGKRSESCLFELFFGESYEP